MCWFKIINVSRVVLSSIEQNAIKTFDNNEVGVGLRFRSARRCGSQEGRGSDEEENKQCDIRFIYLRQNISYLKCLCLIHLVRTFKIPAWICDNTHTHTHV